MGGRVVQPHAERDTPIGILFVYHLVGRRDAVVGLFASRVWVIRRRVVFFVRLIFSSFLLSVAARCCWFFFFSFFSRDRRLFFACGVMRGGSSSTSSAYWLLYFLFLRTVQRRVAHVLPDAMSAYTVPWD